MIIMVLIITIRAVLFTELRLVESAAAAAREGGGGREILIAIIQSIRSDP